MERELQGAEGLLLEDVTGEKEEGCGCGGCGGGCQFRGGWWGRGEWTDGDGDGDLTACEKHGVCIGFQDIIQTGVKEQHSDARLRACLPSLVDQAAALIS